jgi:transcriptional regulator with XRE-family HTH domain
MPEDSLISELANRAKLFHQNTHISQGLMAKAIGMSEANYSQFLRKKRGLSAESTCLLLKFTNLTKQQAIAQLRKPTLTSSICMLQEKGKKITGFDNSGWTAQEGSNSDPNNHGDISSTPDAVTARVADLVSVFKTLDHLTRQSVIDAFVRAHATANTVPTSQKFGRQK